MDLFIDVLDTFPGDKCIETKVLGLLNNIAEVPHLRSNLLVDYFLGNLRYVFQYLILFHLKKCSHSLISDPSCFRVKLKSATLQQV